MFSIRVCRDLRKLLTAPEEFECKLHEKLEGLPGVAVIRDCILVMDCGENEDDADRNHGENLTRLLE